MTESPAGPRVRVVLDTNVVLSALLFGSGRLSALRAQWQAACVLPLVSKSTVQELLRVLAYPKFRVNAVERDELLADYLPYAGTVTATDALSGLPECRDPKDQMFLLLAQVGRADVLVTGDDDLLHLANNTALPFAICTPSALLDRPALRDN